jgi:hypothetical protein
MKLALSVLGVAVVVAFAPHDAARASTFSVSPGQSIQAAIDGAGTGDLILVQPGHYAEAIDFHGKDLRVFSVAGPASTTIDATGLATSVVTFANSEPASAWLKGFTITGGTGTPAAGTEPLRGGGIVIEVNARPRIEDCWIVGNSVTSSPGGCGGGVCFGFAGQTFQPPTLVGCRVVGNLASGTGGGIYGRLDVLDSTIASNAAGQDGGGAAYADCTQCVLFGNLAVGNGGGYFGRSLEQDTLFNNSAGNQGGGVYLYNVGFNLGELPEARHLVVWGNHAPSARGIHAEGTTTIELFGTLVDIDVGRVLHCTLYGDDVFANQLVRNSILWNVPQPFVAPPGQDVENNCIQGGYPGPGNTGADPQFANAAEGLFQLLPGSPCIDTGSTFYSPDPDGSPPDMGALPFSPWINLGKGLAGSAGVPLLAGEGELVPGAAISVSLAHEPPGGLAFLILGGTAVNLPFKGGTLVPSVDLLLSLLTDANGFSVLPAPWPAGLPAGLLTWAQAWCHDAGAVAGFSASNALEIAAP